MILPFDAGQHFFRVVEAADETRAEIETAGTVRLALRNALLQRVQPRPQRLVDDNPERPIPRCRLQFRGHIIINRQRRLTS